jgi:hypothetical protein
VAGPGVVDRREQGRDGIVAEALLDADGALGDGGQHLVGLDRGAGDRVHAEAAQAGHGEEGGAGDALGELAHPGLDVAAELDDREVRPAVAQLGAAAQAGGADDGAGGRVASVAAPSVTKASRTSSRGSRQVMPRPSGWRVGMSFIECTAMSISRASSASSISRVKRPLPPISESGRSSTRSPVVLMTTMAKADSGRPWAAISRARVSCAWASASGLPRVPMRSGRSGSGRSVLMATW